MSASINMPDIMPFDAGATTASAPEPIRCREIGDADLGQVLDLLTEGFSSQRDRGFWEKALARLAAHETPDNFPRFGYIVETGDRCVGVILLIFTTVRTGPEPYVRCNLSSWYMKEAYRAYGPLLIARALRHRAATYFNITPVSHTFAILTAQGFTRYCQGRLTVVPLLSTADRRVKVAQFAPGMAAGNDLTEAELSLLRDHAMAGCISLVCTVGGLRHPFVFAPRRKYAIILSAFLAYCRDMADLARFAGPIGRYLARRGYLFVVVDADGPIPGLTGYYTQEKPKYFRGAHQPRIGDTAYTERTMFGS